MKREFHAKKAKLEKDTKQSILSRYGGDEHRKQAPAGLLTGVSEVEQRFDTRGRELTAHGEVAVAKSKYEEDVFPGNHSSVYGSWFNTNTMEWGYQCCFSTSMNAYCTGQ